MTTVKARYENGKVLLPNRDVPQEDQDVMVTFLGNADTRSQRAKSTEAFLQKWSGVIKGANIGDYKEERTRRLERKHQ